MFNVVCKSLITQFIKNFWRTHLKLYHNLEINGCLLTPNSNIETTVCSKTVGWLQRFVQDRVVAPRKGRSMTGIIRWCSYMYNTRTINRIVEVWRFPYNVYKAFRWRHAWVVWAVQRENCHAISLRISCERVKHVYHANFMWKSCDYHVIFVIIITYYTFHTF